jgi:multiple sugar transport system permease protein
MASSADRAGTPTRHVVLVAVAVLFIAPLVWMLITSLKTQDQVFTWPPVLVPRPLDWGNYSQALIGASFLRYLGNTAALSVVVATGNLISATLVAYSLARVDWKWRNAAFLVVLSTLLLPDTVTIVPLYSLFRKLGMVGGIQGFLPLILPSWFGKAYFIFMLRQFMLGIPGELSHAARVDGAGEIRILWSIIVPLCRPALLSVTLFSLIYTWSDFLQPLVYLSNPKYYTVSVGLAAFQGRYSTQWGQMMAAAAVTIVPIIIVFLVAQRQFVRGLATSGLK